MGKSRKRKHLQNTTDGAFAKVKKKGVENCSAKDGLENNEIKENKIRKKKSKKKREKGYAINLDNFESSENSKGMLASLDQTEAMEISTKSTLVNQPQFHVDLSNLFSPKGPRPNGTHLHSCDVRDLVMFTVLGSANWDQPKWCNLAAWKNVDHTLFIMVGSISGEDYVVFKECFKRIETIFPACYPVKNDGNEGSFVSPLQSYLFYTMKKKAAKRKSRTEVKKLLPSELVLSREQRLVNEFPVLNDNGNESFGNGMNGWVSTRDKPEAGRVVSAASEESRMFAIDCEMCLSSEGRELTRVSVVNESLEVVYDTYVKPKAEITNYLTEYSGITPDILKNVHTRLGDVQMKLLEIISSNDIIIGHSLENDMRVLKIYHDNYIDTSIVYGDERGVRFKPSLRVLVKKHLRREIQNSETGHCSNEDARACMELVKLKLENGPRFGIYTKPNESIFEAFSRAEKKSAVVDVPNIARQHCFNFTRGVLCNSDEEVVTGTIKSLANSDFVFAHLKDFERLLKAHDSKNERPDVSHIKETLERIDANVKRMTEVAPSNTLIVCLFSSGFLSLQTQSAQRNKDKRKAEAVTAAIRKARDCVCFIKVQE